MLPAPSLNITTPSPVKSITVVGSGGQWPAGVGLGQGAAAANAQHK